MSAARKGGYPIRATLFPACPFRLHNNRFLVRGKRGGEYQAQRYVTETWAVTLISPASIGVEAPASAYLMFA